MHKALSWQSNVIKECHKGYLVTMLWKKDGRLEAIFPRHFILLSKFDNNK